MPEVQTYLDAEADKVATIWLDKYRVPIKNLSDERQEAYRQLRRWSTDPVDIDLAKPKTWMEATTVLEADGSETPLPTYEHHLLCNDDGLFPSEMNTWEIDVLKAEMQREGFQAWYRNPSRASQDSLGIAYTEGDHFRIVRPDFIFFSVQPDGAIAADIVDPHGIHLADSLPKLRGLADYAETHTTVYRRIEVVAKIGDKMRVLDLTDPIVREAVAEANDPTRLYESAIANDL